MLHYQNVYMPVVIETSTCTPAVGVKINLKVLSQAISTYSAPVTLTLKLWWIFFLLFGSPSVWLVQLQRALSSSPLFPSHKSDLFFFLSLFFFPPSCRYVFCLKAGTPRQAIHHVWMCSDTSSSQGLISQGKIGVWHVYILFPFLSHHKKNKKTSFLFPTTLQTRRSLRENRCWPVS